MRAIAGLLLALAFVGCRGQPTGGGPGGLELSLEIRQAAGALHAQVQLVNRGHTTLELPADCGAVARLTVNRSKPPATGRRWPGSVGALKALLLERTRGLDEPVFAYQTTGPCGPRPVTVALAPGERGTPSRT